MGAVSDTQKAKDPGGNGRIFSGPYAITHAVLIDPWQKNLLKFFLGYNTLVHGMVFFRLMFWYDPDFLCVALDAKSKTSLHCRGIFLVSVPYFAVLSL